MRTKKTLFYSMVILAVSASLLFVNADVSRAKSMTLKVSHQFAAGDVRDQMGRVFGEMVTERTNGEIKFRHYPAKSLYKPKEQWDALRKGAEAGNNFCMKHYAQRLETGFGGTPANPGLAKTWRQSASETEETELQAAIRSLAPGFYR